MKIAYLLNTYPLPSTTFIRGEIEALEELGLTIDRFSVRRSEGPLAEPADERERERTSYLLSGNIGGLFRAFAVEMLTNPRGLMRALPAFQSLRRTAHSGILHQAAYLMQAAWLRQEARRRGIEHIHAHFGTNPAAVAMLCGLLGGPTFSFTAHGPDEFTDARFLSFDLKVARAAFVVAISNYCRATLAALSKPADRPKIAVARCGLKLEDFRATSVPDDSMTVACIGRLCPQKGQIHIPAAAAALREEFPNLRIVLVGDGPSRAEIEAEIRRHGVESMVILNGWGSNAEVRALLAESRVMLLPSYAEGLPIAIMEALALQRPVISTTIAGIPELVDESCGWLVEPGNHEQLVGALRGVLSASPAQLTGMGDAGRRRVEQWHDRKRLARQLRMLFEQATASRDAPVPAE